MKILKMWLDTGYNRTIEEEIEVSDNITEEECEAETRFFVGNNIEWGWELVNEVKNEQ